MRDLHALGLHPPALIPPGPGTGNWSQPCSRASAGISPPANPTLLSFLTRPPRSSRGRTTMSPPAAPPPGRFPEGPCTAGLPFPGGCEFFPSITSAFTSLTRYKDSKPPDPRSRSRLLCRCTKLHRFRTCPGGSPGAQRPRPRVVWTGPWAPPMGCSRHLLDPRRVHLGHVRRPFIRAGCVPVKPASPSPGIGPDGQA